jgi:hypothetical protein
MIRSIADGFNISSDEIVRNVSKLYMTEPRSFALMALVHSQGLDYQIEPSVVNVTGTPVGVIMVDNFKFEMQLDSINEIKTAVNLAAGYTAGDTSIVVDDGAVVEKYALIYVPRTAEILRVSSVSSNTLTVTRGEAGTTAAALLDNDEFVMLNSAYAENAVSGDATFKNTTFDYNYTQIARTPYGNSRTEQGIKKYGIDNSYEKKKKMALIDMLRKNNGNMWLGGRSTDTTNKFRTAGGVISFIDSANVYDVNNNLTQAEFEFWMRKYALAYNNTKKTLFAGSKLIEKINSWASDKVVYNSNAAVTKFGLSVKTYSTAWGDLDIVFEPYFDEVSSLNGYGIALDLNLIKFVYFTNGVLRAFDDIQENDRDGRKGEWLMEWSVQVNVPKSHAIIKNV